MFYQVVVRYTKPMSHGQTRQTFNADTMEEAILIAHREYGKPLVKGLEIMVRLEQWSKVHVAR